MYAIPFPTIDPVLIEFGPLAIRWYSLAYIAGIIIGWRYALGLCERDGNGIKRIDIDDFVVWATLGIIFGGRLGYVLFYRPEYYAANPGEIIAMWKGGMSFHGGMLGMFAAIWLFTRKRALSFASFADLICAAAPVGLFFGRIANFINGELFGRVTDVPWAMVFPRGGPEPRHPSQLYESGLEGLLLFIVIAIMIFRFKALSRPGLIVGTFMTGYGLARYLIEFVREPDAHLGTLYGFATMGQLLSLPLIIVGVWVIHRSLTRA
jgi:phosphatidylglycerol:prolipoprotein diacylglycerol transferase